MLRGRAGGKKSTGMSLKVGPRSQPAPAIDNDRSSPQSTAPAEPTAPAEKKSEGWLAGIGRTVARSGRGYSNAAEQMRGWVAGKVRSMEQATEPGPNGTLAQKALHFGTTVAGGAIESVANVPADVLDMRGKMLQLAADPAARAKAADGVKQIAANPAGVVSSMASDAWKEATQRPGHLLGGAGALLAPLGAAKLLGVGRAAEAAAAAARAGTAATDAGKAAQAAKSVMDEPTRALIAQFDRAASVRKADVAEHLNRPRPAEQLINDLTKANPNNYMIEGLSVLKHPAEMRTAAQSYLAMARTTGIRGSTDPVGTAMENLRFGVQKFAAPEQHAKWAQVLNELPK